MLWDVVFFVRCKADLLCQLYVRTPPVPYIVHVPVDSGLAYCNVLVLELIVLYYSRTTPTRVKMQNDSFDSDLMMIP